jgi:hypothetical protein
MSDATPFYRLSVERDKWRNEALLALARVARLEKLLEQGADLVDLSVDDGTVPKNATLIGWAAAVRVAVAAPGEEKP